MAPSETGRDLLYLALVLNLLGGDLSRLYLFSNNFVGVRYDSYGENLVRHKAVLDDLLDLGRSGEWIQSQQRRMPVEISAYVLDSLEEGVGSSSHTNEQSFLQAEDADSGVSDVEFADSFTEGRSPSTSSRHSSLECSEEERRRSVSGASANDLPFLGSLPASVHPEDPFSPGEPHLDVLFDTSAPPEGIELSEYMKFGRDLLIDGSESDPSLLAATSTFLPDQEDVENQLMHIDDQLIRLDGNIDNINEGFQHLDEALVAVDDDFLREEENGMAEALLGADQGFLFPFVQEQSEASPFDHWEADANRPLEELLNLELPDHVKRENGTNIEPEPEKQVEIKQEVLENDDQSDHGDGALARYVFNGGNESVVDLKQSIKLEDLNFHLSDHSYAASPRNEDYCGSSIKVDPDDSYDTATGYGDASGPSLTFDHRLLSEGASSLPSLTKLSRESRDERKARQLGLPFTVSEIVDSTMDRFNDLLSSNSLSQEQISLCRDVRRRGKNKLAAQHCRQRKLDLICQLTDEVNRTRTHKQRLLAEREHLHHLRNEWADRLSQLEEQVLRGLNKNADNYSLELMPHSQQIHVALRSSASTTQSSRLTKPATA